MLTILSFLAISLWHVAILLIVLILLFGAKKIPELMRGVGSGIKEFKDAVKEDDTTLHLPKETKTPTFTETSTPVPPQPTTNPAQENTTNQENKA